MARYIEISFKKRKVSCVARLLDEEAPRTCETVWRALPQEGVPFHAKYANNEVYILVPPFQRKPIGREYHTLLPIPGDVVYFHFPQGTNAPKEARRLTSKACGFVDLAIFYDRNNVLFSPTDGPVPGNVFATILKNLDGIKKACHSIWREGAVGERMLFRRIEGKELKKWKLNE